MLQTLLTVTIFARCLLAASSSSHGGRCRIADQEAVFDAHDWQVGDFPVQDWDLVDSSYPLAEYDPTLWELSSSMNDGQSSPVFEENEGTPRENDTSGDTSMGSMTTEQPQEKFHLLDTSQEYLQDDDLLFPMSSLISEVSQGYEPESTMEDDSINYSEEPSEKGTIKPRRRNRGNYIRRKSDSGDSKYEVKLVGDVEKVQGTRPTDFVRSLGPDWIRFVNIYLDTAIPTISRHTARYRIFSRLTFKIAEQLTSDDHEKVKQACTSLAQDQRKKILVIKDKAALNKRLQAYFLFKHPKSAANLSRLGLPHFPKDRLDELQSTDRSVYIPAFQLLQRLANHASYDQTKACPSRNLDN